MKTALKAEFNWMVKTFPSWVFIIYVTTSLSFLKTLPSSLGPSRATSILSTVTLMRMLLRLSEKSLYGIKSGKTPIKILLQRKKFIVKLTTQGLTFPSDKSNLSVWPVLSSYLFFYLA